MDLIELFENRKQNKIRLAEALAQKKERDERIAKRLKEKEAERAEKAKKAEKPKETEEEKGGRKPANREYMVLDTEAIEEEASGDAKKE